MSAVGGGLGVRHEYADGSRIIVVSLKKPLHYLERDFSSSRIGVSMTVYRIALFAVKVVVLVTLAACGSKQLLPATVSGQVTCDSKDAVVGIWIEGESSPSGWATLSAEPTSAWQANYRYTLSMGGRYQVHVGCGGTSQEWATSNKSGYVSGTSNSFVCYSTPSADKKHKTCQQTTLEPEPQNSNKMGPGGGRS